MSDATSTIKKLFEKDPFSQWLGIRLGRIAEGESVLSMTVREEMLNGFGTSHGGIAYSLADSAFAFAANSYGELSVALETHMQYMKPVYSGDVLTAVAKEESRTRKIAVYSITICNQDDVKVALFNGTVYRLEKEL
ncbi:MAG: hydroxyphenylacetyl-CoA thioesterase PaaI [Calditrichota bacterium]